MPVNHRLRVLVADDNPEWRQILTRILEVEHDVVGYVQRGDEIVELARKILPDVVTLDVSMREKSGLNALPALRNALPHAIIVIVSLTATPLYKEAASARGADGYVAKIRVDKELLSAIRASETSSRTRDSRLA